MAADPFDLCTCTLPATYLAVPAFLELLQRGAVRANHQQQQVPVGGGFLFVWMGSLAAALAGSGPGRQLATGPGAAGMPVILLQRLLWDTASWACLMIWWEHASKPGFSATQSAAAGSSDCGAVKALAGGIFGFVLAVYRLPVKGLGQHHGKPAYSDRRWTPSDRRICQYPQSL